MSRVCPSASFAPLPTQKYLPGNFAVGELDRYEFAKMKLDATFGSQFKHDIGRRWQGFHALHKCGQRELENRGDQ